MKFNLRRRDIILIVGFWIVGCALLSTVGYFILYPELNSAERSPAPADAILAPQATVTVTFSQVTAKHMQAATEVKLSQWAADAQLFAIAATWEGATLNSVGEPTYWTYRYYSPGQKRFFFITVNPDGSVMGTTHGERIYNPPQTIPPQDWGIDSSEAVNIWLNYGGEAMMTALDSIQVVAQLQVSEPGAPLEWTVAGYDAATKTYHTVFIDAQTGKVTNIVTSLRRE